MQDQANPYAPPKAAVSDAAVEEGSAALASRGSRFGAWLLDAVVGFIVALPFIMSIGSQFANFDAASAMSNISVGAASTTFVLSLIWIVITIILVSRNGQTIGKKLVGIKVVRSNGSKASLGRIFWLRNIVNALPSAIPIVGTFYQLVDHLFIFNEKRQCLHDKIGDTIVVVA